MTNDTRVNNEQRLAAAERGLIERLIDLGSDATARGLPPDLVVRALLGAGLVIARRYDSGASIAQQLQPVLDHLAEQDDEPRRPSLQ